MQQLAKRLHWAGVKATGPRLAILAALERDRRHPTPEQLYATIRQGYPSLSLSTVYQALDLFIRSGLCRRVAGVGGRLRVDGTAQDHDHAICQGCGEIFDIGRDLLPPLSPPTRLLHGMVVTAVRVEYEVICAACQEGAEGAEPQGHRQTRAVPGSRHNGQQQGGKNHA